MASRRRVLVAVPHRAQAPSVSHKRMPYLWSWLCAFAYTQLVEIPIYTVGLRVSLLAAFERAQKFSPAVILFTGTSPATPARTGPPSRSLRHSPRTRRPTVDRLSAPGGRPSPKGTPRGKRRVGRYRTSLWM
jgi:hypothetical protein